MFDTLQLVLILLATAVLAVVVFRQLRLPPLLGYLLVGIVIGPRALGWIPDTSETRHLAEFGVVFLMFSIGLEFSLPKLVTMRSFVFGLGSAQVVSTMVVAILVAGPLLGIDWRAGFVLGSALAMSSTAIVSKMLAERLELATRHGRQIIGVLLFQDLAVVLLLIIIPALAGEPGALLPALVVAIAKAALVLGLVLFFGQRLMRAWFHVVAMQKSSELFVLNVLLMTLGLAYLTDLAGLSRALGAFIAGMLISETEYRYHVEADIKPFRDVLLGLFFVAVGMQLDLHTVLDQYAWVVLFLVGGIALKIVLIAAISRIAGNDTGAALRTALDLAQAGEFGFVLLAHAGLLGLLPREYIQPVLAAMLLSMLMAPFMIEYSERIVRHVSGAEWLSRAMELHDIAVRTMAVDQHVVVCGYGRSGQNVARLLEAEKVPIIALDLDPVRVREAAAAGASVVYGDAGRREVLIAAGLMRARALVVTFADAPSALKILSHAHELRPELPVLVRTVDDTDLDQLKGAGAAEVVAEVMEGSLMLASSTLMLLGVPLSRVLKRIRATRATRYSLFRGFFHGATDEDEDKSEKMQPRLHSVPVTAGAHAIGRTLGELDFRTLGVEVTAIRRRRAHGVAPAPEVRVEEGDVIVLLGVEESLAAAEMRLMQG
ncbi:MAG TPA: monovalent cation:proton antiporter-2 (CPA2) family protein [Burkholderiales bacterium]|nr:monovalent cation:proton antiporter-2 (CPA2) family protein [Burkholderiales bacterium]